MEKKSGNLGARALSIGVLGTASYFAGKALISASRQTRRPLREFSENQKLEKLGALIEGIKIAMLSTVDEKGRIHSRPMVTQQSQFDGTLWFFTGESSSKVGELKANSRVQISYADPDDHRYISVYGTAEVVRDREKAKELWSPLYRAWFPQGLEDPDLVLLKVKVEEAEYWDTPSSPVVYAAGLAKAIATGKRYEDRSSVEHAKFSLSS